MSLTPREMADMADLQRRLADAEARLRRMPVRFGRVPLTPAAEWAPTPVYQIVGGKTLAYLTYPGIVRRTDQVSGSEFPSGSGGSSGDTIDVPAVPGSGGLNPELPDGVGIVRLVTAEAVTYRYCLNDARNPVLTPDLVWGEICLSYSSVTLEKNFAGIIYQYACIIPAPGIW